MQFLQAHSLTKCLGIRTGLADSQITRCWPARFVQHTAWARYTISDELGREAVRHVTNHVRLYQSNKLAGSQASTKIKVSYIAHHSALTAAKPIHRPQLYTVNQPTQNFFSSFCLQSTKNETNSTHFYSLTLLLFLYFIKIFLHFFYSLASKFCHHFTYQRKYLPNLTFL